MTNPQKSEDVAKLGVHDSAHGYHTVVINEFDQFTSLLNASHFRDRPEYVFRGHRDPSWELLPTLYRKIKTKVSENEQEKKALYNEYGERTSKALQIYLKKLQGSDGFHDYHIPLLEWFNQYSQPPHINKFRAHCKQSPELWRYALRTWAVGQHEGLSTPLLDWTESLLTALYFAFSVDDDRESNEEYRAIFCLNRKFIHRACHDPDFADMPLEFLQPAIISNKRVIAQRGLFTYNHFYECVEDWVTRIFRNQDHPVLIKILIRNQSSKHIIRWLNRAGVNDCTVYPDQYGIATYANRVLDDPCLDY